MSFFKKLFGSKKENNDQQQNPQNDQQADFKGIYTNEYFDKRYTEDEMKPTLVEGCIKMVESYFLEYKFEKKVSSPSTHPANLDQVLDEGIGFQLYCKAFDFEEAQAAMFLAYSFSDFLISQFGFKLYADNTPEFPLRKMVLKYNRDGVVLSLYPFEYSMKALDHQSTFEGLYDKIKSNLKTLPDVDEVLKGYSK